GSGTVGTYGADDHSATLIDQRSATIGGFAKYRDEAFFKGVNFEVHTDDSHSFKPNDQRDRPSRYIFVDPKIVDIRTSNGSGFGSKASAEPLQLFIVVEPWRGGVIVELLPMKLFPVANPPVQRRRRRVDQLALKNQPYTICCWLIGEVLGSYLRQPLAFARGDIELG